MKYLAIALRILIVIIGIKMLMIGSWDMSKAPSLSGVAFILIALYFGLISIFGSKALSCPFLGGCKCEGGKK